MSKSIQETIRDMSPEEYNTFIKQREILSEELHEELCKQGDTLIDIFYTRQIATLRTENARLREALEQIAEPIGWGPYSIGEEIADGLQKIAQEALNERNIN